jgi:hypothetical protein
MFYCVLGYSRQNFTVQGNVILSWQRKEVKKSDCICQLYSKTTKPFLKGQCHEIFTSGFFLQTVPPGPSRHAQQRFRFFSIIRRYIRLFHCFAGVKHALMVSLTPLSNSSPVSMTPVSDTFTVLESCTGVNDTGKKLLTSIIDTGEACICRCQ